MFNTHKANKGSGSNNYSWSLISISNKACAQLPLPLQDASIWVRCIMANALLKGWAWLQGEFLQTPLTTPPRAVAALQETTGSSLSRCISNSSWFYVLIAYINYIVFLGLIGHFHASVSYFDHIHPFSSPPLFFPGSFPLSNTHPSALTAFGCFFFFPMT